MQCRKPLLALVALLASVANSAAQPAAPPQAAPAANPRIDQLLARWEKETTSFQTMMAEVKCVRKYHEFGRVDELLGTVKFMRPDLARLDLQDKVNPQKFERFICTGTHVYSFNPAGKSINVYPIAAPQKGQVPDDGPLPFLFGLKAETAKKRYQFKISKEDKWYTYVDVYPNLDRDKVEFVYARIVLLNDSFTPRQIYYVEPNKNEITYDISKFQRDAGRLVQRTDFLKPDLPAGWQWESAPNVSSSQPSTAPPRIVRPQEDK